MAKEQRGPKGRRGEEERDEFEERVVDITRVAKVVQGGRRFAFRTVVVVGDGKGRVGVGIGKARAVPDSIRKGADRARRNVKRVELFNNTIPYETTEKFGGARVFMKPASPGTGVIAGGPMRAVLEAAGVRDILTKSQGSNNLLNVAMATFNALVGMRSPKDMARMRGTSEEKVLPFWEQGRLRAERARQAPRPAANASAEAPADAPAAPQE